MLCDVQITWLGGVKQRAATALAETHHSVRTSLLPSTLTVRTMWQHYREQYIKKSCFGLHQVPTQSLNKQYVFIFSDKDAEPAARAECTVQGCVWGSEKDHPDRGDLQTTEGPKYHHDGGGTRPWTVLCLLWTGQTLTKWHHSEWRQQPFSQWYNFPRLNTNHLIVTLTAFTLG